MPGLERYASPQPAGRYGGSASSAGEETSRIQSARIWVGWSLFALGCVLALALSLWAHAAPYAAADVQIARFTQSHAYPPLRAALFLLSRLGDTGAIAVMLPLLVGMLALRDRVREALTLALAVGGGAFLTIALKLLVARPAPGAPPGTPAPSGILSFNNYAFPSGHAIYFVTCCLPLAFFVWTRRPRGRARLAACMALLAIMVIGCLAPVFLRFHWASDVLGGCLIGALWTSLVLLLYRRSLAAASVEITSREAEAQAPPPRRVA
jgi:membrane-associated phospholipid phosphatase